MQMHDTNSGGGSAASQVERRQFLGYAAVVLVGTAFGAAGCSGGTGGTVGTSTSGNLPVVDNIESLRGFDASNGTQVRVQGFSTPGDGGEGVFVYSPLAPATGELDDNVGYVIRSNLSTLGGRWQRVADSNGVSVRWFGARGDSTTYDSIAVGLANETAKTLNAPLVVPTGVYRVNGVARTTGLLDVKFANGDTSGVLADWVPQTKATVYYFGNV